MKVPFTEVYRRGVGEHEQASAASRRPRAHSRSVSSLKRFGPHSESSEWLAANSALGEF